jgi:hypothetical protein
MWLKLLCELLAFHDPNHSNASTTRCLKLLISCISDVVRLESSFERGVGSRSRCCGKKPGPVGAVAHASSDGVEVVATLFRGTVGFISALVAPFVAVERDLFSFLWN